MATASRSVAKNASSSSDSASIVSPTGAVDAMSPDDVVVVVVAIVLTYVIATISGRFLIHLS